MSETARIVGKAAIAAATVLTFLPLVAAWLLGAFYAVLFAIAGGFVLSLTISTILVVGAFGFFGAASLILGIWNDRAKPSSVAYAGTATGIVFGLLWLFFTLEQDIYSFERVGIAAAVIVATIALIIAKSGVLLPASDLTGQSG